MGKHNLTYQKALMLLVPIALYLTLYVWINSLMGLRSVWLGFVILWYWGMEKEASGDVLIKSILPGSLVGVVISYLLLTLPHSLGAIGIVIALLIVLFAIVCTMVGVLKSIINGSTFLLMTVISIPMVSIDADHLEYLKVIFVTCAYLYATSYLLKRAQSKTVKIYQE